MTNERPTDKLRFATCNGELVIERLWIKTVNYRHPSDGEWDFDYEWDWRPASRPTCPVATPLL